MTEREDDYFITITSVGKYNCELLLMYWELEKCVKSERFL